MQKFNKKFKARKPVQFNKKFKARKPVQFNKKFKAHKPLKKKITRPQLMRMSAKLLCKEHAIAVLLKKSALKKVTFKNILLDIRGSVEYPCVPVSRYNMLNKVQFFPDTGIYFAPRGVVVPKKKEPAIEVPVVETQPTTHPVEEPKEVPKKKEPAIEVPVVETQPTTHPRSPNWIEESIWNKMLNHEKNAHLLKIGYFSKPKAKKHAKRK